MPERPKRRKNNKNKRKNKNFPNISNYRSNNDGDSQSLKNKNVEEKCEIDSNVEKKEMIDTLSEKTSTNTSDDIDKVVKNEKTGNNDLEVVNIESTELIVKSDVVLNDSVEGTLNNAMISNTYVVESPDQSNKKKLRLSSNRKSKSVDDDESPKITEITEETSTVQEQDNTISTIEYSGLVLDVDSGIEWEKTIDLEEHKLPKIEELVTGTLSITTMPLTVAHCEQAKLLSPEEELSLRHYLHTLNLATSPSTSLEIKTEIEQIIDSEIKHRLRKKGFADDVLSQRLCPPRTLDVIDEEGSGESSIQSRRHSYLSDKKSDNDDLEDDVFEKPGNATALKKNYDIKWDNMLKKQSSTRQIPQKCVLVGAILKEPEITEARGDWTVRTIEKLTGAEVVYLTDSSSSTSSIYDVGEDEPENEQDTDRSVRMITPTIEVTDTENFLKKTFISENKTNISITEQKSVGSKNDFISESNFPNYTIEHKNKPSFYENDKKLHEVVVLTTDNITTNLTVKDVDDNDKPEDCLATTKNLANKVDTKSFNYIKLEDNSNTSKRFNDYDLEMKVLKCELNDAINHLIQEVNDSEIINESSKDIFTRQDSSSSLSSSQCTAIYNPNSSLNDLSNNDDLYQTSKESKESTITSHVNDVIENVSKKSLGNKTELNYKVNQPQRLRDICVDKISSFPYGLKILEELANVSLRIQKMNNIRAEETIKKEYKEINKIDDYDSVDTFTSRKSNYSRETSQQIINSEDALPPPIPPPPIPPPPVIPRNTSLKKSQEVQSPSDVQKIETPYVSLSPSQRMLMEKTNTAVTNRENVLQEDVCKINVNRPHELSSQHQLESKFKNPLKSQTGSRLMALISDPAITSNIKSSLNKFSDNESHLIQKSKIEETKSSTKYSDPEQNKISSDIFKPIPPPRPKKISAFYESDENSDFAENSFKTMKREKRFFHFSTGNLNKDIEDDISTIQNMHKNYINVRNQNTEVSSPRRPSLPKDLCDQQMEYIRQKEKEVEAEIRRLEEEKIRPIIRKGPRAPMLTEKEINKEALWNPSQKHSTRGMIWTTGTSDKGRKEKTSRVFSSSQEELLREKMYSEYLNEIAEREQRKHHKVIKITKTQLPSDARLISKSMSALDILDSRVNNRIEEEFISKAKERWNKLGIRDPESEDERNYKTKLYREPKVIEHKIKVIEAGEEKDVHNLPNHLQEFVAFTADKHQESGSTGESESEEKSTHVVVLCAVMLLVLAIGRYILRLLRNIN